MTDYERVLATTSSTLQLRHVQELSDIFTYFDTDKDGYLTEDQVRLAWRAAAVSYSERDISSGSNMSRRQWLKLSVEYSDQASEQKIPSLRWGAIYRLLDPHGTGEVTADSLHRYLRTTGLDAKLEQVKIYIESVNRFGDGESFSMDEFVTQMMKLEAAAAAAQEDEEEDDRSPGGAGHNSDSTVDMQTAFGW